MPAQIIDPIRIKAALDKARQALLEVRTPAGYWEGELSSSALSTATAVCALALFEKFRVSSSEFRVVSADVSYSAIAAGLAWLADHANADGGWGDTVLSRSNISTTALGWAAFGAVPGADDKYGAVVRRAKTWLSNEVARVLRVSATPKRAEARAPFADSAVASLQRLDIGQLITAIIARYGKDRTFSVPILTMCALSGRFGEGAEAWRRVLPLPFELAAFPQKLFAALRLPVVSYALPALIAIGQVRHHHRPTRNPITRLARNLARPKTLRVIKNLHPSSGGFL